MKKLISTVMGVVMMSGVAIAQKPDASFHRQIQSFEWCCIGPHIGNRGTTVTMHPTDKNLFYYGHSSGGVWQSDDAGTFWTPIIEALKQGRAAGEGSELDQQAQAFMGKLLPVGTMLSEMAKEPTKLLAKLHSVNWMLIHSEGHPTQSAYDVVDMLDKQIDAEVAIWKKVAAAGNK